MAPVIVRHTLSEPFERVELVVHEELGSWIPGLHEGLIDADLVRFRHHFTGRLRVVTDRAERTGGRTVIRLWLEPMAPHPEVPGFAGWIAVTALPRSQTRLTVQLTQLRPARRVQRVVEEVLLARLADHFARQLADRIAATAARRARSITWQQEGLGAVTG